ncbi:MAG: integrase [Legionellales bacterium]|nr:integrase [Legionellales bacterium]
MSKQKLNKATYSIHQLVRNMPLRTYTTRADTQEILIRCIKILHTLGFKLSHIKGLKAKHVEALVQYWKAQSLTTATIKNYMAKLRSACQIMGKGNLISAANIAYDIGKRQPASQENKAIQVLCLDGITDPYLRLSLQAQQLFGLRREESMKLKVSQADQGNYLRLQGSWTKGGIMRCIPIITQAQRNFLDRLHQIVKENSLIPKHRTYKQQLHRYINQTRRAGLTNLHGLRHAYAQRRYRVLTDVQTQGKGWDCPFQGGLSVKEMTSAQRDIDYQVRWQISQELGHSRVSITKTYLG